MYDPLVYTIEVPCDQAQAFSIFTQRMDAWWPLAKRSMSMAFARQPARALQIEPRLGGTIVETGHDGTAYHWGTFTTFEPPDLLRMDFHMGMPPEQASLVEVRFTALGPQRTRVELTHSRWEAFGDMAEMNRKGYVSGWQIIFEQAYKAACSG